MRRIIIAALIACFATLAFSESKSKTSKTNKVKNAPQAASTPAPLASLFLAPNTQEVAGAGGMVTMDAPNHEVVMVRVNADGTRSHACVNNEAAAHGFLSTPLASKREK